MLFGMSKNRGFQERQGNDTQQVRQSRKLSMHVRCMFQNNLFTHSPRWILEWEIPKPRCLFVRACKPLKYFANTSAHMLQIPATSTWSCLQCLQLVTELWPAKLACHSEPSAYFIPVLLDYGLSSLALIYKLCRLNPELWH